MMRSWLLIASLMLSGLLPVRAEEPLLVNAWRGVVAHSPEYAAALARRDAGATAKDVARALWMPTVSAQAGLGLRGLQSATSGAEFSAPGFGTSTGVDFRTSINGGNASQWALTAQQPLFDASRVADAQAARARARLSEAQFHQTEQALMVRSAEALAATVEAEARFHAVQGQREAVNRARDSAQARYQAGDLPVTEWREAQAESDRLAVAELDAQQAFAIAAETYTDLTGLIPPNGTTTATSTAADAAVPAGTVETWLGKARTNSLILAIRQEQLSLAQSEQRRWSRMDGFQLNLVGQLSRESLTGSGDYGDASATQRVAALGVQFSAPLFTGGLRAAQRHAADASLRAAQADLEEAQLQVTLQVRSAWLAASNAHARLRATLLSQQSAGLRLDATRVGHDTGDRTVLELLTAEGAALQAQAGVVSARCEGMLAYLRLAAAAGTLDESTLRETAGGSFSCGEASTP